MGRRTEDKHCINCGTTLPDRYKGRQRIYCGNLCRKTYTANKSNKSSD